MGFGFRGLGFVSGSMALGLGLRAAGSGFTVL